MKLNLQPLITPSLPVTLLIYSVFFGLWMIFWWLNDFTQVTQNTLGIVAGSKLPPPDSFIASIITCGLVIFNSMVIVQLNNRFSFIRTRTFIPTLNYLLISLCWIPCYGNYISVLGALCVLLAVHFSLGMYKNRKDVESAFLCFFFLGLSSFLITEFVVLTLVFWIGFILLNCFSSKVFFASVFGFLTPWILFLSTLFFIFDKVDFINKIQDSVFRYTVFDYRNIPAFVYTGIMLVILIISLFQIYVNSRKDSIQTRNILNFLQLIFFSLLLLFIFTFSGSKSYLPLTAAFFTIFTAYVFTLLKNTFNTIVFIVLWVTNFALVLYLLVK